MPISNVQMYMETESNTHNWFLENTVCVQLQWLYNDIGVFLRIQFSNSTSLALFSSVRKWT